MWPSLRISLIDSVVYKKASCLPPTPPPALSARSQWSEMSGLAGWPVPVPVLQALGPGQGSLGTFVN